MSEDEAQAGIAQLRVEIREREERIRSLRKLLSYPTVTPVQVYWRHHHEYRDPWEYTDEHNALEQAYRALVYAEDSGSLSPVGIEVDGVLMKMEELREQYGDSLDWES